MRGDAYDGRGFIKSMIGSQANTGSSRSAKVARHRSRYEARRHSRLQRRSVARRRNENVAPRRRSAQPGRQCQDRPQWHADRRSARPARGAAGGRAADQRRRRAFPLRRYLFAHEWRPDGDRDRGAVGEQSDPARQPERAEFRRPRRIAARTSGAGAGRAAGAVRSAAAARRQHQQYRFHQHEGRLHPQPGRGWRCATAWCAGPCSAAPSTA